MKFPVLLPFLVAATTVASAGPGWGFDCSKAAMPTDFVVCSAPELRASNGAVAASWSAARQRLDEVGKKALVENQSAWLRATATNCGLPDSGKPTAAVISQAQTCVLRSHEERAQYLAGVARTGRLEIEVIFPAEGTPYGKARTELLRQGTRIAPPRIDEHEPKLDPNFRELDCSFDDGETCRALFLFRQSNGWRAYIVVYVDRTDKNVLEARYPKPVEDLLSLPPPFPPDVPMVRGAYLNARKKLLELGFRPAETGGVWSQKICADNKYEKCTTVNEATCAIDIPVCIAFWKNRDGRALRLNLLGEIDPKIEYMEWTTKEELREFEGQN